MPKTTLLSSSSAITSPPRSLIACTPASPIVAHAGQHDTRAFAPRRFARPSETGHRPTGCNAARVCGSVTLTITSSPDGEKSRLLAAGSNQHPPRPDGNRHRRLRGFPGRRNLFRRSAKARVKSGGMCWATANPTGIGSRMAEKMVCSAGGPPVEEPMTTIWKFIPCRSHRHTRLSGVSIRRGTNAADAVKDLASCSPWSLRAPFRTSILADIEKLGADPGRRFGNKFDRAQFQGAENIFVFGTRGDNDHRGRSASA